MDETDMKILRFALKLLDVAIEELNHDLYGDINANAVYHMKENLAESFGVDYNDLC